MGQLPPATVKILFRYGPNPAVSSSFSLTKYVGRRRSDSILGNNRSTSCLMIIILLHPRGDFKPISNRRGSLFAFTCENWINISAFEGSHKLFQCVFARLPHVLCQRVVFPLNKELEFTSLELFGNNSFDLVNTHRNGLSLRSAFQVTATIVSITK